MIENDLVTLWLSSLLFVNAFVLVLFFVQFVVAWVGAILNTLFHDIF